MYSKTIYTVDVQKKTTILQSGLFFVRYLMSSFAYITPFPPRPKTPFTYVIYLYSDI